MAKDENYSERIEMAAFGIRMAVLEKNGRVTHFDNWPPDALGGYLPAVGDALTTLWDKRRPDPIEHFVVIRRYYIGEFKGQDCWWLLLEARSPDETDLKLFKLARRENAKMKSMRPAAQDSLTELRKLIDLRKRHPGKTPDS